MYTSYDGSRQGCTYHPRQVLSSCMAVTPWGSLFDIPRLMGEIKRKRTDPLFLLCEREDPNLSKSLERCIGIRGEHCVDRHTQCDR